MNDKTVPPSVGEFAIGERDQLLARVAELEASRDKMAAPFDLEEFAKRAAVEMEKHDYHGFEPVVLAVAGELLSALKQPSAGVVLPEPLKRGDEGGSGEYGAAMIRGFNACLREVARLNPARAQLAAPAGVPDALCRAFITAESGDGNYRVVIKSETLQETQQVHNWLCRLNASCDLSDASDE